MTSARPGLVTMGLVLAVGCSEAPRPDVSIHYEGNGYVYVDIEGRALRITRLVNNHTGMLGMINSRAVCDLVTTTTTLTDRQVADILDLLTEHKVFAFSRNYPTVKGRERSRHAMMRYTLRVCRGADAMMTSWDATNLCDPRGFVADLERAVDTPW